MLELREKAPTSSSLRLREYCVPDAELSVGTRKISFNEISARDVDSVANNYLARKLPGYD